MTHNELNLAFEQKYRRGMFNPVKRFLTNQPDPEDRFADAVAQAWHMYTRYALEKDTILDDALLVNGCRLRAIDLGHRFVPGRGRRRDAMGESAYQMDGIDANHLDGEIENVPEFWNTADQLGFANGAGSPEPHWISRLDLERWLANRTDDERAIWSGRFAGLNNQEIGKQIQASHGTVCRRARQLGRELAEAVNVEIS
jgi:hypothetical protein